MKPDDTWENAVNRILGRPQQGGTVEVKEYAPPQQWDPAKVFPTREDARRYGAPLRRVARPRRGLTYPAPCRGMCLSP